jgi:hypothetical protein
MVVDDFGTCLVMTGTNALEPKNRGKVIEGRRKIDSMLREILKEGVQDRTLDCPDLKMSAMFIFGAMNWLPRWFHADGKLSVEELSDRLIAFVMRAIAADRCS